MAQERSDAVVTVTDRSWEFFRIERPLAVVGKGNGDDSTENLSLPELLTRFTEFRVRRRNIVIVSIPVLQEGDVAMMQRVSEVTNALIQFGFDRVLIQQGSSFIPPRPWKMIEGLEAGHRGQVFTFHKPDDDRSE